MGKKRNQEHELFTDLYYERGHWGLKIRQTLVAFLGWLGVIIPILVTVVSAIGFYNPFVRGFWHQKVGIEEIQFFGLLLIFAFFAAAIFTITMALIQNRKRDRVVEQWPTYDPLLQKQRKDELNHFMDERFGDATFRQSAQTYDVQPEQNLDTDEFQKLFQNPRQTEGVTK